MKYIQTEVESLVRDPVSNALLNKDQGALLAYKMQRDRIKSMDEIKAREQEREARIDKLETDIDHIKSSLNTILEKLNDSSRS